MANSVSNTITDETLSKIVQIESNGRPKIKATTSTALGLSQFLNGTWRATVKKHRPDVFNSLSDAELLALRTDPSFSIEMLARHTEDNAAIMGGPFQEDGDLYLAHFAGVGVARKLLRAPEDAPVSRYFSKKAIAANRTILEGKTVGQVRAWAARKMAAAGKTNWVAKYYKPNLSTTRPRKKAAPPPAETITPTKIEEEIEAEATVPPHGESSAQILGVKRRLKALGYHEVGLMDGPEASRWGGRTAAAIAAFKNDRELPGAPVIDEPLLLELDEAEFEKWTRPIAPARADASAEKVERETGIKIDAPAKTGKLAMLWTAISSAVVAAFNGILGQFQDAWDSTPVIAIREFASDNLALLAGGVVAVAGYMWWQAQKEEKKVQQAAVEAFREGRIT